MNKLFRITTKMTIGIIITLSISSCAALGSKTLYNNINLQQKSELRKICLLNPTFENVDFYKNSGRDFYLDELTSILSKEGVNTIVDSTITIKFDNTNTLERIKSIDCDYILLGKVERLTSMGMTRDFKVEYKLINPKDGMLKYHSKYSTTFGKTYVIVPGGGMPTEEQLMRDAIKLGLTNLKREILER